MAHRKSHRNRRKERRPSNEEIPTSQFDALAMTHVGIPIQRNPSILPTPPSSPEAAGINASDAPSNLAKGPHVLDGVRGFAVATPIKSNSRSRMLEPVVRSPQHSVGMIDAKRQYEQYADSMAFVSGIPTPPNASPAPIQATFNKSVSMLTKPTPRIVFPEDAGSLTLLTPTSMDGTFERKFEHTRAEGRVAELKAMINGKINIHGLRDYDLDLAARMYVAIDCEMVGVGPVLAYKVKNGFRTAERRSSLARVSVVDFYGRVLLDEFVRQSEPVTDYRTGVSGIRPQHLTPLRAAPFSDVRSRVLDLMRGRTVVGHAIHNDFEALRISPSAISRYGFSVHDTQRASVIVRKHGRNPGLKKICIAEFDFNPQAGEHSSITDARATMAVFRLFETLETARTANNL